MRLLTTRQRLQRHHRVLSRTYVCLEYATPRKRRAGGLGDAGAVVDVELSARTGSGLDDDERLAVLDGLTILERQFDDRAVQGRLDLIDQIERLDSGDDLPFFDRVAY